MDLAASKEDGEPVINYRWKYIPKEEIKKHWNIRSGKMEKFDIIQKTEAVSEAIRESDKRHWLGILWNITRNIATDMKKWGSLWRTIGIDGISDYAGDGMIHSSEPMQAVFFSRYAVDQVATFDNKVTPEKIQTRSKMKYARIVIPAIKNEFKKWVNRTPNKRELDWALQLFEAYTKGTGGTEEEILDLVNNRQKLSRKGSEYVVVSAIFRDKKYSLIDMINDLANKTEKDKDLDGIMNTLVGGVDIIGLNDPKEIEEFKYQWNKITMEVEHELGDPLREGLRIKRLQEWYNQTEQLWNKFIKSTYKIEFPYKQL